ncbi:MAG: hypothetical protein PHG35_07830 [Dehalococcoidales bacterium]|nr:hypothetical protein [Dehalococcoidales bacterium]
MNFIITGKIKDICKLLDIKTKKELQDDIVQALERENGTIAYFQGKTVEQLLKTAELLKLAGKGCFLDLKGAACNWDGSCEICPKWQEAMAKAKAEGL